MQIYFTKIKIYKNSFIYTLNNFKSLIILNFQTNKFRWTQIQCELNNPSLIYHTSACFENYIIFFGGIN